MAVAAADTAFFVSDSACFGPAVALHRRLSLPAFEEEHRGKLRHRYHKPLHEQPPEINGAVFRI
jgi:hypothetical protein